MRRFAAFLAWVFGAGLSGVVLFALIILVSRVDRHAWITFALAAGVALWLKFWPRMSAGVRWIIGGLYALSFLTWQIGPWLHVGDRIGVNSTIRSFVNRYDQLFYDLQIVAMVILVILMLFQWIKDRKTKWFSVWLVLAVSMGLLIIQYSGSSGAPGHSADWLANLLHLSPRAAEFLVIVIRKCIHFVFYGCLALFTYHAGVAAGCPRDRNVWVAGGYALMHAIYDESRQGFTSDRTSSVWDVLLDSAGMALFLFLAHRNSRARKVQA